MLTPCLSPRSLSLPFPLRSHRDFSPEQIAALKEIEEKARVVRLKQKLISKEDPLSVYKLQDSAFGKVPSPSPSPAEPSIPLPLLPPLFLPPKVGRT